MAETRVKVYDGPTLDAQLAAYQADAAKAQANGWRAVRRERFPDRLKVTWQHGPTPVDEWEVVEGPPVAASRDDRVFGAIVMMAGGAGIAAGLFLPWATTASIFPIEVNGTTSGYSTILLLAAAAAVLAGLIALVDEDHLGILAALSGTAGLVALAIFGLQVIAPPGLTLAGQPVATNIGVGIYVGLLAGIVSVVGAVAVNRPKL